jgi:hypothetical protein
MLEGFGDFIRVVDFVDVVFIMAGSLLQASSRIQ